LLLRKQKLVEQLKRPPYFVDKKSLADRIETEPLGDPGFDQLDVGSTAVFGSSSCKK
jgi:hypothetical protein